MSYQRHFIATVAADAETKSEPLSTTRKYQYLPQNQEQQRPQFYKTKNPQLTNVYEIKKTSQFRQISSPMLTQEKRQRIQDKLQLERVASQGASQRIKNQDMFIKYRSNPFLETGSNRWITPSSSNSYLENADGAQSSQFSQDIVQAVTSLKDKSISPFQSIQFQDRRKEIDKISSMNQRLRHPVKISQQRPNQRQQLQQARQLQFQQIVSIQQRKHNPAKLDNVFKVINPNFNLPSTYSILQKSYFHWGSYTSYSTKYRLPIEDHLSSTSRNCILKETTVQLTSEEASINLNAITFQNIMGVASGRLTPKIVYNSSNDLSAERQEIMDKSTNILSHQILYKDNTQHRAANFNDSNFERDEVQQYLKLSSYLSKDQQRSRRKYENISRMIQSEIETKNQAIKTKVNDIKLHSQIQGNINDNIYRLMSTDETIQQNTDRLIMRSKQFKDRTINIKNKALIESLQLKRQSDAITNGMLRGNKEKTRK